ncbi:hypothetical protein Y032_0131g1587 [Ancylostoma ceylanicum]|uniref:Uncharacterized protein n=1 Tax=Ancylostoma ceylanicum TaxID=53326 RepID=A0A016T6V7_9BILA|nr:hypothetical protein Y032_0131g1587 [Ancylostoma ceylanicum]
MGLFLLLLVLVTSFPVRSQFFYPGMMYPGMMYPGMMYPGMMYPGMGMGWGYRRNPIAGALGGMLMGGLMGAMSG